jgi:CPA2 family monovalent cation:H+ antiporter-2
MSLSQIGEFSFIIASLGLSLNVTSDFLYPVAVAVSVLTTFTTPYMIRFSEPVFKGLDAVMPVKLKNKLNKYSFDAQRITEISDWKKVLKANLINAVIFSVIIIAVILLSTRYLESIFQTSKEHKIITAIITLVVLAPFLWALAFRRMQRQAYANVWTKVDRRGPLILLQVSRIALAIMYIGFFFYHLFSPAIALWGVMVACFIIALLYKRIQMFYGRIEERFLTNYNERESGTLITNEILTPWDTHITKFELNAQYPYIGKTLSESKLREEFGINIVKVIRGNFVINIPTRGEYLFPNDQISVIGTDEQLTNFKTFLELSTPEPDIEDVKQRISLHHFTVSENSSLVGQNIRNSEIRERCQGLVVGVERNGQRIVNPESDLIFEVHDTVWLVGNETLIQSLIRELAGS